MKAQQSRPSSVQRHRSAPSQISALSPAALKDLDFGGLIRKAERLAQLHLKNPKVQRVEVSVTERGPGVLVAFLNPRQAESYLVRLNTSGEITFEDRSSVPRDPSSRRLPVFDQAPTSVRMSPAEALAEAMAQNPGATYQILSLAPGPKGPVYSAFHPSAWQTNPATSVPANSQAMELAEILSARPEPITSSAVRKLVDGKKHNPFTAGYANALSPDNPVTAFFARLGILGDVRSISVADAHALAEIFGRLEPKDQRETRGFIEWQLQTTPIQVFGRSRGEDAAMILAKLLLD